MLVVTEGHVWKTAVSILSGTDFSYCRFAHLLPLRSISTDHYSPVMELGPPIPDIPLWEPAAAVTPVTAVSTNVVSQVAQSVVEVSPLVFIPVPS